MKYIISTLGCKVNQYETQAMETLLQQHGHEPAAAGECADIVIVNTCAVTAEGGRKSRQTIRRLRDENPGCTLAVGGCYSQLSPDDVAELGASVIFGAADRAKLVEAAERAAATGETCRNIDEPFERREFEHLSAGAVSGRTRAMLKIQDGCVNFCSYCIIPYTRGRLRSLSLEAAEKDAAEMCAAGYKEIVLTGIEIASYGRDLKDRPTLADVIETVAMAAPGVNIRLGSIEPTVIDEDFCRRLAPLEYLCRHFHLSLQSGCDRTLKNMNRKYDTARFFEAVELLKRYFPGCALTADLISGFPGETEQDHADTLAFIRRCGFADMHIFPYSRRPGTVADKMEGQLENAVKNRRAHEAQAVAAEMKREYLESQIGQTLRVLFETEQDKLSVGHSDNYLLVGVEGEGLRSIVKSVKIRAVSGDMLVGDVV